MSEIKSNSTEDIKTAGDTSESMVIKIRLNTKKL